MMNSPQVTNEDYEFTEDQRLAAQQMMRLRQSLEDADDDYYEDENYLYGLGYPTYDVKQRLLEINEQWNKEPLPEESRLRLIEFKSDTELTSVVTPQPYPVENDDTAATGYDDSDEGGFTNAFQNDSVLRLPGHPMPSEQQSSTNEHRVSGQGDADTPINKGIRVNFQDDESVEPMNGQSRQKAEKNDSVESLENEDVDQSSTDESNKKIQYDLIERLSDDSDDINVLSAKKPESYNVSDDSSETMLMEINGKYELLTVKELRAMGHTIPDGVMDLNAKSESDNDFKRTVQSNTSPAAQRRPQSSSRPKSATSLKTHMVDISYYRSPYALTPEQKELKEKREAFIKDREKSEKERIAKENKEKRDDAESAFQWWLNKKEEERKKNMVNKQVPKDNPEAKKKENKEAFDNWIKLKQDQIKIEKLLKRRQQRERNDGYFIRSREECDQAFRRWVKEKRKQEKQANPKPKIKQRAKSARLLTLYVH